MDTRAEIERKLADVEKWMRTARGEEFESLRDEQQELMTQLREMPMSTDTLPAVVAQNTELSVDVVLGRLGKVQELMKRAMTPDIDFGKIPGTGGKPTLLKPGAEKLCLMFRLCPEYKTAKFFDGPHLTVESTCRILGCDGNFLGEASAIASTREAKYAYRKAERECPKCGKAAIIKGQEQYGGGWICWKKKDGCGAKFPDDAEEITSQKAGRVENADLPDSYNTVLRIAEKRAYIAAVRLVTGSSSLFDEEYGAAEQEPPPEEEAPAKQPKQEPSADVQYSLKDWYDDIQTLKGKPAEEYTAKSKQVANILDRPTRTEVAKMLKSAAAAAGLEYDQKAKKYTEAKKSAGAA